MKNIDDFNMFKSTGGGGSTSGDGMSPLLIGAFVVLVILLLCGNR